MAHTIASTVAGGNFIIKGTPLYLYGQLAGTYKPCTAVYESSAGTFTVVDADTAATLNYRPMIVGYKERILSTGAKSSIDTAYATTDTGVPILIGFADGEGQFVLWIEDPGADVFRNGRFLVSDTEGTYEALSAVAAAAAGDTEANFSNVDQLVTGDRYMKARWTA